MRQAWRELLLSPLPAFALLSAFLLAVHEPWRDEAQPWLIARDAEPTFLSEMDSEGSPGLWYALQWPLAELGLPFDAVRVLHSALALAAVSVLVLHGPFSRLEQWLVAMGYFVLYEYNAIARSYVLLLLLLFVVAALWRDRLARPLRHGLLLALVAQVAAHGTLLAVVLGAEFGISALLARDRRAVAAAALPVASVLLAVWQMVPGPDLAEWRTHSNAEWDAFHAIQAGRGVLHAFLPLPEWDQWRWAWTLLDAKLGEGPFAAMAAATFALTFLPFLRRPRVLAVYAAGALVLVSVYYLKYGVSGQMRHHGILFLHWLFCLWLARQDPAPAAAQRPRWRRRLAAGALALLLLAHVAASASAIRRDAEEPFSGGPGAAAYLERHGLAGEENVIGVYPSFIGAPILVHLEDRRTFYYPQTDQHGSYVRWTREDAVSFHMDRALVVERVLEEGRARNATRVLLVTSFPMWAPGFEERFTFLASFESVSPGDAAYIYESTREQSP